MKLFGRILVGIVAMVLTGLAVYGVGVVIKNNNDKNSRNDTNVTLSIQEARELVEKVYTACKGGESDSIAPAAVYEKEYVDPNDCEWISFCLTVLERGGQILKLVDREQGNIKNPDGSGFVYLSYVLTKFGIKFEMFWIQDDLIYSRSFLDLYYDNDNKDSWTFILSILRNISGTFINDETSQSYNNVVEQFNASGVNTKIRKIDLNSIKVNQSFFEGSNLIKDNVQIITTNTWNTIKHESIKKQYADSEHQDYLSNDNAYENMTDDEINQIATSIQNHIKANYTRQVADLDKYIEIKK